GMTSRSTNDIPTSLACVLRSRQRAKIISTAMAARTNVKRRFPNSMTPLIPISGVVTYDSGVQRGHSEHPNPEAVSRTAPPVTMIPACDTTEATASTMVHNVKVRGIRTSDHRRVARLAAVVMKSILYLKCWMQSEHPRRSVVLTPLKPAYSAHA